jgi:hypothetical protein
MGCELQGDLTIILEKGKHVLKSTISIKLCLDAIVVNVT